MIGVVSGRALSLPSDHFLICVNSFFRAGKGSPLSNGRPSGEYLILGSLWPLSIACEAAARI